MAVTGACPPSRHTWNPPLHVSTGPSPHRLAPDLTVFPFPSPSPFPFAFDLSLLAQSFAWRGVGGVGVGVLVVTHTIIPGLGVPPGSLHATEGQPEA